MMPSGKNICTFPSAVQWWMMEIYTDQHGHVIIAALFTLASILSLILWRKGKKIKSKKTFIPQIVYDLAKTAYKPVNAKLCMKTIEENNYDINQPFMDTFLSLFMCACLSGDADLVSFMIARGADVNNITCHGDSALYLATYGYLTSPKPDIRLITSLLASGCDINHQNSSGFTALHQSSAKGNLLLTQYLLFKGADPDKCNNAGVLPLQLALNAGHSDVVEYLIHRMKPLRLKLSMKGQIFPKSV